MGKHLKSNKREIVRTKKHTHARFLRTILEKNRAEIVRTKKHTAHTLFSAVLRSVPVDTLYRLQTQNVPQLNVVLKIYYTNIS